jgi:hypothetical protein
MRELSEREKWFQERVGKIIWRNKTSCECPSCLGVYDFGLKLGDDMHASYVCDCEGSAYFEDHILRYFDTKEERDQFEKDLEPRLAARPKAIK